MRFCSARPRRPPLDHNGLSILLIAGAVDAHAIYAAAEGIAHEALSRRGFVSYGDFDPEAAISLFEPDRAAVWPSTSDFLNLKLPCVGFVRYQHVKLLATLNIASR